jgi:eukaryotic-like serine/threonine-protein kinase
MRNVRLADVIDSVAEGADVNWDEVTSAARSDEERHLVADLRTVADIAQLHRVLATTHEADTGPPLDLTAWGDLEIVERLGRGTFGEVYLARDARLNRFVALKLLAPALTAQLPLAAQLLEEARILASVRHPNVVGVYGAAIHQGRAGFWMEYVAGATLEDRLTSEGPLSAEEAAAVGRQVCRALAAVHNARLIHRDVKARNIMRERGGRIVLMDFGAGITVQRAADTRGTRVGTPMYLAPETLGGAPATVQSDIYAVGVLLFHLVSGRFPYAAASLDDLKRVHASAPPTPLQSVRPDLPHELIAVIEQALSPLGRRFESAGDMAAALDRVIVPRVEPAVPTWRVPALWMVAAALVASVAVGIRPWFWPEDSPPKTAATVGVHTIAVMPFANRTGQPSYDELAAGLARDVQRQLRRLRVPVRGGAPAPRVLEAAMFARDTAADAVVTASLDRQSDERFALAVSLVTRTGSSVWTERYSTDERQLPGVARRVALDIARAIGVTPPSGAWAPPMPYPAYDAYQRGRAYAELRTPASLLRSIEYYRQAIRLAPDHAEPWAGLADSYIALGVPTFGTLAPREARRLATEAAVNAVRLDSESAEAHTSLAFIAYFHDWDWATADRRFQEAIQLDPQYGLAHEWYAEFLNAVGRQDEALAEIRRALEIEPQSILYHRDVAWHYFFQRRYPEAIAQLRQTLERDPDYAPARTLLGRALVANGEFAEGLEELRRVAPALPRPTGLLFVAYGEAASGAQHEARQHLDQALALASKEYVAPTYVALVHTALNQPTQALAWLERGYETQDSIMVNICQDPRLDPLRQRPEFQELLGKMKFPQTTSSSRGSAR